MDGASLEANGVNRPTAANHHAAAEAAEVKRQTGLFLVVYYVLEAARRFRKALNPPVNFRKRGCSNVGSMAKNLVSSKRRIVEDPEILEERYTHTGSGHLVERKTPLRSGNKFCYLVAAITRFED